MIYSDFFAIIAAAAAASVVVEVEEVSWDSTNIDYCFSTSFPFLYFSFSELDL